VSCRLQSGLLTTINTVAGCRAITQAVLQSFTLWQGPPGTGKTRTLLALVEVRVMAYGCSSHHHSTHNASVQCLTTGGTQRTSNQQGLDDCVVLPLLQVTNLVHGISGGQGDSCMPLPRNMLHRKP
jgi:hypothetical protein